MAKITPAKCDWFVFILIKSSGLFISLAFTGPSACILARIPSLDHEGFSNMVKLQPRLVVHTKYCINKDIIIQTILHYINIL
jgi:hypothetical protein